MTPVVDVQESARRYVAEFEAFSEDGGGSAPGWLSERQAAAMARFAEVGFPTTRQEAWRFTDVRAIAQKDFVRASAPIGRVVSPDAVDAFLLGDRDRYSAVFVGGYYDEELSSVAGLPIGVKLGSLASALETHGELIEQHLARYTTHDNPFTTLNTAFIDDGAFVFIPRGTVLDRPLQLVFVASPESDEPSVWHPRSLVIVEREVEASLVESYVAAGGGSYWTNAVTEVVVGEGARLNTYRIQREDGQAYHTATTQSYQERDSVYSCVTFALGASLTRHDINAVLDGEGAECTLDGLSLLTGRQHVDHHTTLEHAKPHCTSWEYFNGIFDERARGVFNGRIVVRPGAQRTDSKQTNNNLLLSERARADSQPQLEIYADDVKCTHGATLGPIDERQLYYLQTRGMGQDAARNLLTYGFCGEVLNAVTLDDLRRQLDELVRGRLAASVQKRGTR
ncbi:MAG: Fe-S cluster assembly protein SufD [Gemmatimonadales bacterium]|nr:Fe-S cluster assembly protein SufD [Gemmatimonadales bacterium]NIN10415.1 Fe-S cluster assembly protein SufD [Gemmatimonadales bacterium]NIN49207.1 Fe-S cluster assembly protein SufD [Gemmatimonadales bacterium]NIP06671.1 Fe-S cluster assembly protein SufD [Gemmatimonadales bacterium]NIR00002.1 Fe-S cluster assembly protein SufD [Gemmatimonadales bacterium]